jgi:recombinational DNA repair ATPase RecF
MINSPTNPPTIWQALDTWGRTLKPWQRCVLAYATRSGALTDAQVGEVYERFLRDSKLREQTGVELPEVEVTGRPTEQLAKPLRLESIAELAGVNALPDGSSLQFGPALTVIYGRNGAGKSGFARLLANACFSRQRPDILGNIYSEGTQSRPGAKICISIDGAQQVVPFGPGVDDADLRRISVFDSAVARHHVSQTAPFEFKPAGFDVFPEMVRVNSLLVAKLEADCASRVNDTNFSDSFIGVETEVSRAVAAIGPNTDLALVRGLAVYGPKEKARLEEVVQQLAALQSKSPKEALAQLKQASADLKQLAAKLASLGGSFSSQRSEVRTKLAAEAKKTAEAAAALGSEQFKRPFFKAVGSPKWEAFARAAHALARQEGAEYPQGGDRCLLCERPFDEASQAHVSALLAFVEGSALRAAADASEALKAEIRIVEAIDANVFADDSRVRFHVHRLDPSVEISIADVAGALAEAKQRTLDDLRESRDANSTVSTASPAEHVTKLATQADADIERLEKENPSIAIQSLELERQTLRHREVLSQLLPAIEKQVASLVWIRKAEGAKSSLNPRHITEKEKDLFAQIIGEGYRKRLASECKELECALPVQLQTAGQKGKTVRSLTMKGGHRPDTILSEGEQKAVALADFLTEVGLNPANAGIVLDDPVTSQDHQRKERIADRLVKEAKERQVIVFTHDLPFLNRLVLEAEEENIDLQMHWVERDVDDHPGRVKLNDAPVTSKAYDSTERAKTCLAEAKKLAGTAQHEKIMLGLGALRRTIEETIVKRLFKGVVPRWSDRVVVTALRKVDWDSGLADALVDEFEALSAYIEGHSHTDEATGAPPQAKLLDEKIQLVDALIKRAKAERVDKKKATPQVPAPAAGPAVS